MVKQSDTQEVARTEVSRSALSELESMADAIAFLQSQGVQVTEAADVLGDGFAVVQDKNTLVGEPFLILQRDEKLGDYGPFSILLCMSGTGRKFVVTDGGAGIHKQLEELERAKGINTGIMCRKGLTRSDYTYTNEKGQETPATTYYLDTAA